MTPPTPARSASTAPVTPPFRVELGGGYTSLNLGVGGESYSGGQFQARMGENFHLHPQHALFLNGVFRLGNLSNSSGRELSMVHFGLEGGYEATLAPGILSAFVFAGLGINTFYSTNFNGGYRDGLSIDNQSALALTLGGGFTLGRGILVFSGGWQPNFGLQVQDLSSPTNPPIGYNPTAYFFNVGINVAAFADWLGAALPRRISAGDWFGGIQPGFIADTTYTYNFRQPSGGHNGLRLFDSRWDRPMGNAFEVSLERPTSAEYPFGFRADLVLGEDAAGAAPRHSLRTDWFYLQQLYAALRLPIHHGITLKAGQIATPIGAEVLEGPLNNQISRSFLFNYGIPFTHTGLLMDIPFMADDRTAAPKQVTLTTGPIHGWDNVVGHDSGFAWLAALAFTWNDEVSTTLSGTVGDEGGRLRTLVHALQVYRPGGSNGPFTLTGEGGWGHENAGAGQPGADWAMASLLGRYDFTRILGVSGRGEAFYDPQGARTGTSQTCAEGTATFHVTPLPWLRGRLEYRHDYCSGGAFRSGTQAVDHQDTLGVGVAVVLP